MSLLECNSRIPDRKKIVFLGDSITADGTFIAYMEAYFAQHVPGIRLEFINLGVSSETASGLSEPDHPWPRPHVHTRLKEVLDQTNPDWVVVCYGMNDGVYHPLSEERFRAYREGMTKLICGIKAAGARAIVMTPPPFDKDSYKSGRLLPAGKERYSYQAPYSAYNDVLAKYAEWIVSLEPNVDCVVNIFDPLLQSIAEKRSKDASYSSGDGIHPNADGHWIMAKTLLNSLFNISLECVPDYVDNRGAQKNR